MGTTAEKGARVLQSIAEVQEGINNLGGSLTDQTPFKDFKAQLDNIYNNLPKTEYQEGTEVNLGVTSKGKLDYDNGVVGIGQSSQDSTTGKNLLNYIDNLRTNYGGLTSTINSDSSITTTGIPATDYATIISIDITNMLENGQRYYISQKTEQAYTLYLQVNIKDNETSAMSYCSLNTGTSNSFVADTTNKTYRMNLQTGTTSFWGASSRTITNTYQLEKGNSATSFEKYTGGQASPNPSYPQTINSVTGNQEEVVSGKNRLQLENGTNTTYNVTAVTENGKITLNGTPNSNTYSRLISTFTANITDIFTLSPNKSDANSDIRLLYTINDGSLVNSDNTPQINLNIGDVVKVYLRISTTSQITNFTLQPQLEQGSTATTYEPYITPTSYQLSLGDIELNAIGNYKDELIYDVDEDKVYKKAKVKEITLNGTENWELQSINSHGIANFRIVIQDYLVASGDSNGLSNYFGKQTSGIADTTTSGFLINNQKYLYIRIESSIASTKQQFETWLSNNTPVVCYVIDAVLTEITDTTLINQVKALYNAHSNNGTTIITSNGNLPMIIKCRALKGE